MRCLVGFVCALALGLMGCSETSGTGGSGGAAGIGGGGVGGHGSGVGDPNCGMYCDKLVECYPMYRDACMEGCADEAANEAAVSEECASAAAAQRACVGDLSCEEVSEWGYRVPPESFPCLMETTAADSLCETTCQNDDECDDGRECSWDRCIEGSCQHGLANCPCEAPLSDHCTGSECWTWDEAVAGLRESCEPYRRADAGQCGELRYIETYWGYDSGIRYFDASGVLVAVAGCTDCPCIECGPGHEATCIHYGPVPECEPQLEEILCEEPW